MIENGIHVENEHRSVHGSRQARMRAVAKAVFKFKRFKSMRASFVSSANKKVIKVQQKKTGVGGGDGAEDVMPESEGAGQGSAKIFMRDAPPGLTPLEKILAVAGDEPPAPSVYSPPEDEPTEDELKALMLKPLTSSLAAM